MDVDAQIDLPFNSDTSASVMSQDCLVQKNDSGTTKGSCLHLLLVWIRCWLHIGSGEKCFIM